MGGSRAVCGSRGMMVWWVRWEGMARRGYFVGECGGEKIKGRGWRWG